MKKYYGLIFSILLLLALAACTPKTIPTDIGSAEESWRGFLSASAAAENSASAYRVNASLRYDTPQKDGHRVLIYLWGNGKPVHPVRLDVQAGIGVMAAKIREDAQLFLAYIPREEKAYYNVEGSSAMLNLGMPLPFTLGDLSLLMTGRYEELFLRRNSSAAAPLPGNISKLKNGNLLFKLDGGSMPGGLELDASGCLAGWHEKDGGWLMELSHPAPGDENGAGPHRIKFTHPAGYEAIVVVKDREYPQAFTPEHLDLVLPPDTKMFLLQEHK